MCEGGEEQCRVRRDDGVAAGRRRCGIKEKLGKVGRQKKEMVSEGGSLCLRRMKTK